MFCPSCTSATQVEFPAEMLIHAPGPKNIDGPGVFVFPTVLVCLRCGFAQFTVAPPQLASLSQPAPESKPKSKSATA